MRELSDWIDHPDYGMPRGLGAVGVVLPESIAFDTPSTSAETTVARGADSPVGSSRSSAEIVP